MVEWAAVVDWVRAGLANGSRRPQFRPANDRAQFRFGDGDDERPKITEIQNDLRDFCREYPAIVRGGIRFLVRETEEDLLDAIDAINPIPELGKLGCAYLPDRSLFACAGSGMAALRDERRRYFVRALLGQVSFSRFGPEERDRLGERLWQSRVLISVQK